MILRQDELKFSRRWVKILPPLPWYTNFREQKFWKLEYEGNGGRILTERSDRWNSADQRLTGTPNLNLIPEDPREHPRDSPMAKNYLELYRRGDA